MIQYTLLIASRVIILLLPVKTVSAIIFYLVFLFFPRIVCSSNPSHNIGVDGHYPFVKIFMEREKYIYIISCMYFVLFQRKPCPHLTNRFNSLKHVQHFDTHDSKQRNKYCTKKWWSFPLRISSVNVTKSAVFSAVKKKEKDIQLIPFRNVCNITKHIEN